jgi:hypoxanthine-guanine phosphoribosyltransferase
MTPPIEKVLYTTEEVDARIAGVAREIEARYDGRPVKLIGPASCASRKTSTIPSKATT